MNYLTMVNRVLLKAREDYVSAISSDTATKSYFAQQCVLDAVQDLAALVKLKCLRRATTVSTTSGTVSYALGSSVDHVDNVRCTTTNYERKLFFVNQDELDIAYPRTDDTSLYNSPCWYTEYEYAVSGNNAQKYLKIYPTPDNTYTLAVRYYRRVSDMSSATDVPSGVDEKFHRAIVDLAFAKFIEYKKDEDVMLSVNLAKMAVDNAKRINRGMLEGRARITIGADVTRVGPETNPLVR